MLQTLLKIGKWQSEGKSKWDRFLEFPEVKTKDGRGNPIKNYTLPIIFDLDEEEVIIDSQNLKEYDPKDVNNALPVKMKGSNSKAICTAGIEKRLGRIYQALYGKEGEETESGQLLEAIENANPDLLTIEFKNILSKIFKLKNQFLSSTLYGDNEENSNVDIRKIYKSFDFGRNEKIALIVSYVKSNDMGLDEPVIFSQITEYKSFINQAYFGIEDENKKSKKQKLCYASGHLFDDVEELNLTERFSLNKMFVTTTQNFASTFDKGKFALNYQVSSQNQEYLDNASDYLLNQGFKVRIAGLDHVIIPQFLSSSDVDLEMAIERINQKSDMLFNLNKLESTSDIIKTELDDQIFWMNFVAFDTNGNFFKSTALIKDISNHRISKMLTCLNDIDWWFRDTEFFKWDAIMSGYFSSDKREPKKLNFYTFYKIIPIRDEKRNKALELFKSILENRRIIVSVIFEYFVELILCHYYKRYEAYDNRINRYSKDKFYFAVRDSVFQFLALIQFLKILNLINMDVSNQPSKKSGNPYDQNIQEFFDQMEFNQGQQAMFYLGRMLNKVEYIQKGKTKTVIQKVNFNGMDIDNIERLRVSLFEKAKQYNKIGKIIFIDKHFGELFKKSGWDMNPKEAVFFLLTGYSFGASTKDAEELQEKESIEIN